MQVPTSCEFNLRLISALEPDLVELALNSLLLEIAISFRRRCRVHIALCSWLDEDILRAKKYKTPDTTEVNSKHLSIAEADCFPVSPKSALIFKKISQHCFCLEKILI